MSPTEKEARRKAVRRWRERNPTYDLEYSRRPEVRERNIQFMRRDYIKRPWAALLSNAKERAKKKGLEFSLTTEWALRTYTGNCALTGISFIVKFEGKRGGRPYSPSIDRIDQTRGYTPDNCRFILHALNCFRGVMCDSEMENIARRFVCCCDHTSLKAAV